MRDIKPLMLPKLAAARNAQPDTPIVDEHVSQAHPDSSFSASQRFTPLNRTFSTYANVPQSSSLSLLSSSSHDSMASSSKLSRLHEDPMDGPFASDLNDEEIEGKPGSWCLCSVAEGCPHSDGRTSYATTSLVSSAPELAGSPFSEAGESRNWPQRRRSGDSPASIASRVGERFPSLSPKKKNRRTASSLSRMRASTPPGGRSSQASSTAGSVMPPLNTSQTELPQSSTRAVAEHDDERTSASPVDILRPDVETELIDGERFRPVSL